MLELYVDVERGRAERVSQSCCSKSFFFRFNLSESRLNSNKRQTKENYYGGKGIITKSQ